MSGFLRFRSETALHACVYLLQKAGGSLPILSLMKLLYMADKESLLTYGDTITGDSIYAMQYGPVPSNTYDMLKYTATNNDTGLSVIRMSNAPDKLCSLIQNIDPDMLSEADIEILDKIFEENKDKNQFELAEKTHQFEEWKKAYKPGTSSPIDLEDILRIYGRDDLVPLYQDNVLMDSEWHELLNV